MPGPKGIPVYVGRHLVVKENKDSNWVWKLKGVVRPTEKKDAFYCRVFDEAKAAQAGVKVKDWSSLDEHLDLILWEGYFDKETTTVRTENFCKTLERMTCLPKESKVIYEHKDGKKAKVFDTSEWWAAIGSHAPDKREQMVR